MTAGRKQKLKKAFSITTNIIVYAFFALCVFLLVLAVVSKRDVDGAVKIFGREMRIVVSSSMEKCDETDVSRYEIKDLPVKTAIFIKLVPEDPQEAEAFYAELKKGDVLTFLYEQKTISHRIVSITKKGTGGYIIVLQGDNRSSDNGAMTQTIDTSESSSNCIIGKVTGANYVLGVLVCAVQEPLGLALIIIVPCAIILILQVVKIVNVVHLAKREKAEQKAQAQEHEIEALKRKIAELEGSLSPEDTENNNKQEGIE